PETNSPRSLPAMWTQVNSLFRPRCRTSKVTSSCQRRIPLLAELLEDRLAPAGGASGSAASPQAALPFEDLFTAVNGAPLSGAWKLLASTPVTNPVGNYRFEVFGPSLKLFLDDLQAASASDSAITAAGAVGLWAPQNAILDNFGATSAPADGMALPVSDGFD